MPGERRSVSGSVPSVETGTVFEEGRHLTRSGCSGPSRALPLGHLADQVLMLRAQVANGQTNNDGSLLRIQSLTVHEVVPYGV